MGNNVKTFKKSSKKTVYKDYELQTFQANLKRKFQYVWSFFSIVLIILGLYLLLNGILSIINKPKLKDVEVAINHGEEILTTVLPTGDVKLDKEIEIIESVKAIEDTTVKEDVKHDYSKWKATDYKYKDIDKTDNYIVKYGDTLWEIAEAVYGSGFEWKRILEANKNSIGRLPNGQQSLIYTGQSLVIP